MHKNINLRGEGMHCAGFSYQLISICKSPSLQAGRHDAKSEIQIISKVLDTNSVIWWSIRTQLNNPLALLPSHKHTSYNTHTYIQHPD